MIAFTLSDAILAVVLAAAGSLFVWTVGHEVEKDVTAAGGALGKVGSAVSNPLFVIGAIVVTWLIVKFTGKKGG